jgi:hypothetical protein
MYYNFGFKGSEDAKSFDSYELGFTYNFLSSAQLLVPVKDGKEELESIPIQLVMIPDDGGSYSYPAIDQNGDKHYVNNLVLEQSTPSIQKSQDSYISIPDNEIVLFNNIVEGNSTLELNQEVDIISKENTRVEKLKISGTGYMPSETNRRGLVDKSNN